MLQRNQRSAPEPQGEQAVEVLSIADYLSRYEDVGQHRTVAPYGDAGFQGAEVRAIRWTSGRLLQTTIKGGLVNVTTAPMSNMALGLVRRGSATVFLNGARYQLNSGESILFLPGDMAVQAGMDSDVYSLRVPLSHEGLFQLSALPHKVRIQKPRELPPPDSKDLLRLFEFTVEEHERANNQSQASAQVEALGNAILERVTTIASGFLPVKAESRPEMLDICLACETHIAQNLSTALSTSKLATAAMCSVRTLHRAFESVAGTTPADYLARARVNRGRSLMLAGTAHEPSLTLVASQCGFPSARSFVSAYTSEFGETPKETVRQFRQALFSLGIQDL